MLTTSCGSIATDLRRASVSYGLVFVIHKDRFEILCFINLVAIEAMDVIHAISPGNHLRMGVSTSAFHNTEQKLF